MYIMIVLFYGKAIDMFYCLILSEGDRVLFAESQAQPGVPVVYRTPEERATNPDRLNLDRYSAYSVHFY